MKKRAISLLMAFAIGSICTLSAFAASGFNRDVMRNGADIYVDTDEMEGREMYIVDSSKTNSLYNLETAFVNVIPSVYSSQDNDSYLIYFRILTLENFPVNEIIFKIGNHRYVFSELKSFDCGSEYSKDTELYTHTIQLWMDSYSLALIDDIVKNQGQEVKVRIKGQEQNLDFTLVDEGTSGIINLYNLYAQAGGLREDNLKAISDRIGDDGATLNIYND